MKNKFFADPRLLPVSFAFFFISIVVTVCLLVFDGYGYNLYLAVGITMLCVVFPFLMSISSIIIGCIMIEISEEGIATILFRKRLKFFKWEEISEVKTTAPDKGAYKQISFSRNKDTNARRRKAEKISFSYYCCDISKEALLKRYAPEYIIEKLNDNTNQ